MADRIRKDHVFTGFGFPVFLRNAPMRKFRDEEVLDVDLNRLGDAVLAAMPRKPARFAGNEIKFIRHKLKMTMAQFGRELGLTHSSISQWESQGHKAASMDPAVDFQVRLMVSRHSATTSAKRFSEVYDELLSAHRRLASVKKAGSPSETRGRNLAERKPSRQPADNSTSPHNTWVAEGGRRTLIEQVHFAA